MEKINKKIKSTFKRLYSGTEFTLEDALNFFDTYMSIDKDEAILHYKKNIVRSLIGMKENGKRIFVSFRKDGQYYYSNMHTERKITNLDAMYKQIMTKSYGLQKTGKEILKRKKDAIEGQVSIIEGYEQKINEN